MARAVSARQQGDTYQARAFWLKACRLFLPHTKVERVGYEINDMPHFDDIAVFYGSEASDWHGNPLDSDYYQIKWHVDLSGSMTLESLVDPMFIGSRSTSLLQRLKEAFETSSDRGESARFNFVTTWGVQSQDILGRLVSGSNGQVRMDTLFSDSAPGSDSPCARRVGKPPGCGRCHTENDFERVQALLELLQPGQSDQGTQ